MFKISGTGGGGGDVENAYYDLTDYLGCASDPDIVPDFGASFNSKTETKMLSSRFPMFKFPDADLVRIKCTVLVCQTNCPLTKCGRAQVKDVKEKFEIP